MTGKLFLLATGEAASPAVAECPENRLVKRLSEGDEDAFNELYRKYAPMVHGILVAKTGRDDADDVLQEVFIAAFRTIHTLRDATALGPWLAAIARNMATDLLRRKRPTIELAEDAAMAACDPSEADAREIFAAIRSLPEAYRETLVLRLVEGMTGPEIAEQTGLKHDSVRVNLHRGMKLLRQRLGIEVKK